MPQKKLTIVPDKSFTRLFCTKQGRNSTRMEWHHEKYSGSYSRERDAFVRHHLI